MVIENQGDAPATEEFWVDVYIAPDTPPTAVDDRWDTAGDRGVAWGVTENLAAGASLTLTLSSSYYDETRSSFSGNVGEGTAVYAHVDVVSHEDSNYGAVRETHERDGSTYNNILQAVSVE